MYGRQDIHKLRGVDRPLTHDEKLVFAHFVYDNLVREYEARAPAEALGVSTMPSET